MQNLDSFDPSLFGAWPPMVLYEGSGDIAWSDEQCRAEAQAFMLEIKSGSAEDALRILLNDMVGEMRAQFDYFQGLRAAAEAAGKAQAEGSGDETATKLARADVKLAVDAMSLIVRTLEKIDALQRQMAHDREMEIERHADGPAYEDAKRRLLAIIEQRAEDRALAIAAERGVQRAADAMAEDGLAPASRDDAARLARPARPLATIRLSAAADSSFAPLPDSRDA